MKRCRQTTIPPHAGHADALGSRADSTANAGFTLIEVVIAVVILGILSGAVAVNWASFIRYQELRQDAHGFHKELLALKAKALETGEKIEVTFTNDSIKIILTGKDRQDNSISIVDDNDNEIILQRRSGKPVALNKNTTLTFPLEPDLGNFDGGVTPPSSNSWSETKSIIVKPVTLDSTLDSTFNDGWVVIGNGKNKEFCIMKPVNSIKPELYSRRTGGTWTRM